MLRLNQYQYVGEIGKGTYGTIEVYKKDDIEYVIKRMTISDSLSQVIREIEIYKKLRHPHIVSYIDHKYGATSLLMLERGRCTLSDFINHGQYGLNLYNRWIYQTALALDYLHYHNLIHTDLKPANIIMFRSQNQDFYPKLCDLGCCQIHLNDREMSCYIQTENYRSPEIKRYLDHKRYHGTYDHKIDIWSLGIIMVDLLCHQFSYGKINYYKATGHLDAVKEFCRSKKFFEFPENWLGIINGCLAHDPEVRWNSRTLLSQAYWTDPLRVCPKDKPVPQEELVQPNFQMKVPQEELDLNSDKVIELPVNEVATPIGNHNLIEANNYEAKTKAIFRYPIQDRKFLSVFMDYYQELPERLVTEAYYFGLKMRNRNLKINQWRLDQYCLYILSLLYFNEPPGLLKSIFSFKNKEVFQILNASHDLVLF